MHYYKRNIGDYHKKAGRLSLLQHGVYTLLMDAIYDREQFPTKEEAADWCWASTPEEILAVDFVLSKFFVNGDGIYRQKRLVEEIDSYHAFCEQQTEKGRKGGRPKGINKPIGLIKQPNGLINKPSGNPIKAELTLTTNHKPATVNKVKSIVEQKPDLSLEVFNYWQITFSHQKSAFDDKRKRFIKGALKNYSLDDCKKAILGCSKTPHNMGKNDGGQIYDGIHIIFKDADNIDRFIVNASGGYDRGLR